VRPAADAQRLFRPVLFRLQQLGQPEVQHFYLTLWGDHDIGRLQIPVHDAGGVRGGQGGRDLDRPAQRFVQAEAALA